MKRKYWMAGRKFINDEFELVPRIGVHAMDGTRNTPEVSYARLRSFFMWSKVGAFVLEYRIPAYKEGVAGLNSRRVLADVCAKLIAIRSSPGSLIELRFVGKHLSDCLVYLTERLLKR
jgi:hypothetical protein